MILSNTFPSAFHLLHWMPSGIFYSFHFLKFIYFLQYPEENHDNYMLCDPGCCNCFHYWGDTCLILYPKSCQHTTTHTHATEQKDESLYCFHECNLTTCQARGSVTHSSTFNNPRQDRASPFFFAWNANLFKKKKEKLWCCKTVYLSVVNDMTCPKVNSWMKSN